MWKNGFCRNAEVINITWDGVQGYTTAGTGTEKQGKPELNADMVRDCWDGFADGHLDGKVLVVHWCNHFQGNLVLWLGADPESLQHQRLCFY